MEEFSVRVIQLIKDIPAGQVMTYGQIAKLAGSPRGARQVVRILHSSSRKYGLPWHRVINAKGEISIQDEQLKFLQKQLLEEEGVFVPNYKIDLEQYRFHPTEFL